MTIEPDTAAPLAANADCDTLPPKPQPVAAVAVTNAMKENEEAGKTSWWGSDPFPLGRSWAAR